MPPCDFWIDLFFLPVHREMHHSQLLKKNIRDETASYVIHCEKHE